MFIKVTDSYGRRGGWRELLYAGWRLGRVFGIEVRLHLILLLLIAFDLIVEGVGLARGRTTLAGFLLYPVSFWIIIFGSVFLHELGHCYGSWLVGARAHSILLWPLGGLARTEGSDRAPSSELVIIALGPAVNLILGPLAQLLAWAIRPLAIGSATWTWLWLFLQYTAYVNYFMAAFNLLLPLFPMDSARILRALLSIKMPSSRATYVVTTLGMWVGGLGLLLVLFGAGQVELAGVRLGGWMALIFVLGLMESYTERIRIRYEPAYSSEVNYGGNLLYTYTSAEWRTGARGVGGAVGRLVTAPFRWVAGRGGGSGSRGRARRGATSGAGGGRGREGGGGVTARVIEIEEAGLPETDRTRHLKRLRELDQELKEAVRSEDFDRARRLKEQIAALRSERG